MRQAGFLAGAGIYALLNNIQRLAQDHDNALTLAKGLNEINNNNIHINMKTVQTNMVFADIDTDMPTLYNFLKQKGIIIDTCSHLRLVTHLDISKQDIDYIIQGFKEFFI